MFSKTVIFIVSVLVLSVCVHNSEQRPKETDVGDHNKGDDDVYDEVIYNDDDFITRMAELIDSISSFDDDYSDSAAQPKEDEDEGGIVVEASDVSTNSSPALSEEQSQQLATQCTLPVRKGVCRALIPRWNYDPVTKTCKEFKFGGCDGNGNNFSTQKLCESICKSV